VKADEENVGRAMIIFAMVNRFDWSRAGNASSGSMAGGFYGVESGGKGSANPILQHKSVTEHGWRLWGVA